MIRMMDGNAQLPRMHAGLQAFRAVQWVRLMRFGAVGASGVVVNTALLLVLVQICSFNHLIAAACGAEASILSNFVLNDRWTFRGSGVSRSFLHRAARYNLVALGGNIVSLAAFAGLTVEFGIHYLIANVFAIGLGTASNYILNSRFTWPQAVEELVQVAA